MTFSPAVDGFGAGPELPHPESTKSQLKVLRDLLSFGPDLLKPLYGCLGEGEVTDCRMRLQADVAATHGWEVTLGPNNDLVLAWVQQTPVVAVSS